MSTVLHHKILPNIYFRNVIENKYEVHVKLLLVFPVSSSENWHLAFTKVSRSAMFNRT